MRPLGARKVPGTPFAPAWIETSPPISEKRSKAREVSAWPVTSTSIDPVSPPRKPKASGGATLKLPELGLAAE